MRKAFVAELVAMAEQDERIVLLTGDLGFMVLEPFADAFPRRFMNVGVAEANMIGIATGLASQGFLPYCYSIATFISNRAYEQIRNGPVAHRLPVHLVGVGGGFAYGSAGMTHFALEDIGLMRMQPGMTVIAPIDDAQTRSAIRATAGYGGPVYYRLHKDSISLAETSGTFDAGRIETVGDGSEITIVATGGMARHAMAARTVLEAQGIQAAVALAACLKPFPRAAMTGLLERTKLVLTVEDHYPEGGLGSAVAELIADSGLATKLVRLAVCGTFDGRTGSEEFMLRTAGLSVEAIAERAAAEVSHYSTAR